VGFFCVENAVWADSLYRGPGRMDFAILPACSLALPATSQAVEAIETAACR
jgi:hypothetical protein|tara:strand:+ start:569 stop:721 length:153 start_codon:yes stop_codon:yes gene_type:complete